MPHRVAVAAVGVLTALMLVLAVFGSTGRRTPLLDVVGGGQTGPPTIPTPSTTAGEANGPTPFSGRSPGLTEGLVLVLVVLVFVGIVVFVLILAAAGYRLLIGVAEAGSVEIEQQVGGSLTAWSEADDAAERARRAAARRSALERLTVRGAVIACWADLEDAAAQSGHPRYAHETSRDLIVRLGRLEGVDVGSLQRLRELFREARFSEHDLPESARDQALAAIERLEVDLHAAPGRVEREAAR